MKDLLNKTHPLHDETLETKGQRALKQAAYAEAYANAEQTLKDDVKAVATLRQKVSHLTGQIEALQTAIKRPITAKVTPPPPAKTKGPREPELRETRMVAVVMALAMAKHLSPNISGEAMLEKLLPSDAHRWNREKAAAFSANTTNISFGASLVASIVRGFWDQMQDVSIFAQLASRTGIIPFEGNNSLITPARANQGDLSIRLDRRKRDHSGQTKRHRVHDLAPLQKRRDHHRL